MSFNYARSTSSIESEQSDSRIYFVAILRNEETLVKHQQLLGNYDQILEQVIPKIVKTNGIKMTFNYEQ